MIVADHGTELVICTQPDHAQLSAKLLDLWRRDGLPEHPRRKDLLFAVREHDNGWQRADAAPRASTANGWPVTFDQIPPAARLEIWRRSVQKYASSHPYATLLIARHAREVNQNYLGFPGWPEFFGELDTLTEEISATNSASTDYLAADYTFLNLTDSLSLGACGGLGGLEAVEGELGGYRFALQPGRIRIAPFPLAGATTLMVASRELPRRSYIDTADLTSELLKAVWHQRPVGVEPFESS